MNLEDLEEEALRLSATDRSQLIERLILSLDKVSADRARLAALREAIRIGQADIAQGKSREFSSSELRQHLAERTDEILRE